MSRLQSLRRSVLRTVRTLTTSDTTRSFLVAFAVIGAVVAASCDKVPLTSPTGSTITLSSSTSIVPVDGTAIITATVIESSGTAVHNGTLVSFLADFGRLDPQEAQTINGKATTTFRADGRSGSVAINALSGSATTQGSSSTSGGTTTTTPGRSITLLVGAAAAGRIAMRAEPQNIPQAGGTTQVFATVFDTSGNPLVGVPVSFTIGGTGTGAPTGSGTLTHPTAITNSGGVAQTGLTTNQTTAVTATVASVTTPTTASLTITALASPTVVLACPATTQSVGVSVNCTVTPTPASGVAIQNVTINWGDGTGEQPVGSVTGAATMGHTYTAPGTYSIVASATDLNSQRGQALQTITVNRVLPSLTLDVPGTGTAGVAVAMSVAPAATQTQPITGVVVDFGDGTSRTFGAVSSAQGFTKTYSTEGGYTVTATATDASGQQGTTSKAIVISRGSGPTVALTVPGTINRNQPATFTVTATPASGGAPIRTVTVTMTDGTVLYTGNTAGTFVYTFLGSGNTVLTALATDTAGNVGRTQASVFINP